MARYRGGDDHYADLECAYAELERYLVLSCNEQARYAFEVFSVRWVPWLLKQQSRRRYAANGFALSPYAGFARTGGASFQPQPAERSIALA
jgi:hypothetical protein